MKNSAKPRKYFYQSDGRLYIVLAPSKSIADHIALRQARLSESYRLWTRDMIRACYTNNPSMYFMRTPHLQIYASFLDVK